MNKSLLAVTLRALVAIAIVLTPFFTSSAQGSAPAMWSVARPGADAAQIYLFGSIHFGNAQFYPLPGEISVAFARSDTLVVEIDITGLDPTKTTALLHTHGMQPEGKRLSDEISRPLVKRLRQTAARHNLSFEMLDKQRAWLASFTLAHVSMYQSGLHASLGIDQHFLAKSGSRQVLALETLESQFSVFAEMNTQEHEHSLRDALDELNGGGAYIKRLVAKWRQGDAREVHALFEEKFNGPMVSEPARVALIDARNTKMTQTLMRAVDEQPHKVYFVVVGAAHMLGDTGLVTLLEERGYTVKRAVYDR